MDDGSHQPIEPILYSSLPLHIIRHEKTLEGDALKTGFRYFTEQVAVHYILTIDADLQHPPEKIPAFIDQINNAGKSMVIGYRLRKLSVMPFHRILSNYLTSLIISILTGQLIRDSQCGFRLFESSIVKQLPLEEHRFHLESENADKSGLAENPIGICQDSNHLSA